MPVGETVEATDTSARDLLLEIWLFLGRPVPRCLADLARCDFVGSIIVEAKAGATWADAY